MEGLIVLNNEEIEKIKENKLVYSIGKCAELEEEIKKKNKEIKKENIELAKQNKKTKNYLKMPDRLRKKCMYAESLNEKNINTEDFKKAKEFLDKEFIKIHEIREHNQPYINELVEEVLVDMGKMFGRNDTKATICARIHEYVTKTIKYSEDYDIYDDKIAFASDYSFACYNGIPMGKYYIDTLITREGSSFEICSLMQALGKKFHVNIKSKPVYLKRKTSSIAEEEDTYYKIYYINTFECEDGISYMDPTSIICNKNNVGNYPFLTKTELLERGIIVDEKDNPEKEPEGVKFEFRITHSSSMDQAASRIRNKYQQQSKSH